MAEILETNGNGHNMVFSTSQEAWEYINELFVCNDEYLLSNGGISYGTFLASYSNYIQVRNSWVDPDIDFNNLFGYKMQKWTSLVNNYIDLNMLDIVKSRVMVYEKKKTRSYNVGFIFDNSHNSGKGCLLSITFSKRYDTSEPTLAVSMRSSEVTKRLILDFLLIHRIGEFVYGSGARFSVTLSCPNMYTNAESLAMYSRHRKYKKVFRLHGKDIKNPTPWGERVMGSLEHISTVDPSTIKYKLHLRAVKQLQKDSSTVSKPLLAKNLYIIDDSIEYPENCISLSDRRKYANKIRKKNKDKNTVQ